MATAKQYTPQRRRMMQIVMWMILAMMLGLAGLVSSHRRGVFEAKLDAPVAQEGLSIRLPRGWELIKHGGDDTSLLFTATDAKEDFRRLRVWRNWVDDRETPINLVFHQLRASGAALVDEIRSLAINGHPAAFAKGEIADEELGGLQITEFIGAIVPPSGHAVIVEFSSLNGDSADESVIRRVLASAELENEPALSGTNIQLPSIGVLRLPDGFATISVTDANKTAREARSVDPEQTMKRLIFYPLVLQQRDGENTLRTMISFNESGFTDSRVTEVRRGEYQIEPAANAADRAVRPIRAYALTDSSGKGFLAVFKGGDGEQWIDNAWQSIRDNAAISGNLDPNLLAKNGAEAVKFIAAEGLAKLFPEDQQEQWLLAQRKGRTVGWAHLAPKTGALGGTTEARLIYPPSTIVRAINSYQGAGDLRSYRASGDTSFASSLSEGTPKFEMYVKFSSQLRDGKINLSCTPGDGKSSTAEQKTPENYLPGGWLTDLLPVLPDQPMLLRTDMAFGYEHACISDLLSVIIRTDREFRPNSEPEVDATKCKIVEVAGSGEITRWYFDKNKKLVAIHSSDGFSLVSRDEADIRSSFSRSSAMRP